MTDDEALETLLFHSGLHDHIDDPRWESGFLGSLRPYRGHLNPSAFHEVMQAMRVLAFRVREEPIDRLVLSAVFGIVHLGRTWGVDAGGMLRRNGLIAEVDVATLDEWLHCISDALYGLLEGLSEEEAFQSYRLFCLDRGERKEP